MGISSKNVRLVFLRIMWLGSFLLIFYHISFLFQDNKSLWGSIVFCIIIAGINDFLRDHFIQNHDTIRYYVSYILSNVICAYISCQAMNSGTQLYMIVLIVDLLIFNEKIYNVLLAVNIFTFAIPYKINMDSGNIDSLTNIFINYILTFGVVYIMRSLFIEKRRVGRLNEELTNANLKLKEYADRIELLTITEERNRIAQELHDSIGHSLVALNMNLEYAENIAQVKPEKTQEVIQKAHGISKECMNKLREAVKTLKEESVIVSLREEVQKLFDNFSNDEKYKFQMTAYEEIDEENTQIKGCIYKIIMEGITNGIKHGNAEEFQIDISKQDESIKLQIKNNGTTTREIKKSNGITGMENRVKDLGGTISFSSLQESGFIIQVNLPLRGKIYETNDCR